MPYINVVLLTELNSRPHAVYTLFELAKLITTNNLPCQNNALKWQLSASLNAILADLCGNLFVTFFRFAGQLLYKAIKRTKKYKLSEIQFLYTLSSVDA